MVKWPQQAAKHGKPTCNKMESAVPREILLVRLYNPRWVLACSTVSLHLDLFMAILLQFLIFTVCIACFTSSSHFIFGLPLDLEDSGLHRVILFVTLPSYILSTCPNQANVCLESKDYKSRYILAAGNCEGKVATDSAPAYPKYHCCNYICQIKCREITNDI
jgi:hypothetical protein